MCRGCDYMNRLQGTPSPTNPLSLTLILTLNLTVSTHTHTHEPSPPCKRFRRCFRVHVGVARVCGEHWRLRLGSMTTQLPHPSPSLSLSPSTHSLTHSLTHSFTHGLCNPFASSGVRRRFNRQSITGNATAQKCCSVGTPTSTIRTR